MSERRHTEAVAEFEDLLVRRIPRARDDDYGPSGLRALIARRDSLRALLGQECVR